MISNAVPGQSLTTDDFVHESEPMHRPRRCTESEVNQAGVTLAYPHGLGLACHQCGQVWYPMLPPGGGRLPRGYWRCPNRCNTDGVH